jgi:hypothetical protein
VVKHPGRSTSVHTTMVLVFDTYVEKSIMLDSSDDSVVMMMMMNAMLLIASLFRVIVIRVRYGRMVRYHNSRGPSSIIVFWMISHLIFVVRLDSLLCNCYWYIVTLYDWWLVLLMRKTIGMLVLD